MKYKKLSKTAKTPVREHNSAGYDLFLAGDDDIMIRPMESPLLGTDIAVAVPDGHVGLVLPKSGLGHKEQLVLGNLVGVIDEDYRGEIKVSLWNRSMHTVKSVKAGQKIAQMLIVPISTPDLEEVDELDDTTRGGGGFGSTGV